MIFLSFKANARVKLTKTGHGLHSSKLVVFCVVLLFVLFYVLFVFVLFYVLFVCKCVLYYCHRVFIELQLTNISYIASFDSTVRRPDDDRISRSKHVASYTINNNKNSCA